MTENKELTASYVSMLSEEEIDEIQSSIDNKNMAIIEAALKQGKINDKEAEYLEDFYHDGMSIYREVYRSLYETFGSPIYTTSFNPQTGEIDCDTNGKAIDYTLKSLTPFIYTKLKFLDKNNNSIFVIFPKMKSAERAIEKLDKEFGKEYFDNLKKAIDPFFVDEDPIKRVERIQNVPTTTSQLNDILRLTITCKYLHDVKRIMRKLSENSNNFYFIIPEETRDRFEKPLNENEKQYYDIKIIMHQKSKEREAFNVELQLKIDTLFYGDIRTHDLYEKRREIDAKSSPNDPAAIKELNEKLKKEYDNLCKIINQNAIHQYNMTVLDKISRIENSDYRPLRVKPDNKDGTYNKCCNFIIENYMVESYDSFDPSTAFSSDNILNKAAYLKIINILPQNFDELKEGANEIINEAFNKLNSQQKERFINITRIAHRYQHIIQKVIDKRKIKDGKTTPSITPKNNIRPTTR